MQRKSQGLPSRNRCQTVNRMHTFISISCSKLRILPIFGHFMRIWVRVIMKLECNIPFKVIMVIYLKGNISVYFSNTHGLLHQR